jgi:hypothetical protein
MRRGRSPRRARGHGSAVVAGKTELTVAHGAARDSEREGERFTTLTRRARSAERERERERERAGHTREGSRRRPIGPTRQRERGSKGVLSLTGRVGTRGRPGWAGLG